MKILIHRRNVEVTERLRAHVERRLGHALGRFGDRIGRVLVRFSDHEAPLLDLGKRCEIDVGMRMHSIRVKAWDADLFEAANWATDSAARAVARKLHGEHEADAGFAAAKAGPTRRSPGRGRRSAAPRNGG